jgi:hypothetical protein
VLILSGQLDLYEQIHSSPDRVQQTRKREIEKSHPKSFDVVAAMNRLIDL